MPFTLEPLSRRNFIKATVGVGAGLTLANWSLADLPADEPIHLALLSDVHIAADAKLVAHGQNMADNLRRVVQQVLAADPKPSVVFIDGDLAYHTGEPGDYQTFFELIKPLREAGLPLHLTMGNHDDRKHFQKAMYGDADYKFVVPGRFVDIVTVGHTNWFLLDSLDVTNAIPGKLGEAQIQWLDAALKQHADRPAIIMLHHDPQRPGKPGGVVDCDSFYQVLHAHKHVKVVFFGHTHVWQQAKTGDIPLINFPAIAYRFHENIPLGWTSAILTGQSLNLTLHVTNGEPHDGEKVEIAL